MKVNITLDDELMARIDVHADRNYMSRSGLISLAVTNYLNSNDIMLAITDIALAMRKIADTGNIDDDSMEKLQDFERFCNILVGAKK